MGDGNFHIIPLMKLEDPVDRKKILPAMKAVNNLVLKYGGSLSGEHNDGLVRARGSSRCTAPRCSKSSATPKTSWIPSTS